MVPQRQKQKWETKSRISKKKKRRKDNNISPVKKTPHKNESQNKHAEDQYNKNAQTKMKQNVYKDTVEFFLCFAATPGH